MIFPHSTHSRNFVEYFYTSPPDPWINDITYRTPQPKRHRNISTYSWKIKNAKYVARVITHYQPLFIKDFSQKNYSFVLSEVYISHKLPPKWITSPKGPPFLRQGLESLGKMSLQKFGQDTFLGSQQLFEPFIAVFPYRCYGWQDRITFCFTGVNGIHPKHSQEIRR